MSGRPIYSEAQRLAAIAAAQRVGTRAASRETGISQVHIRRWVREAGARAKRRDAGPEAAPPGESVEHTHAADAWDIRLTTRRRVTTLAELVEACAIDTAAWEVVSFTSKAYQMGYKQPDGTADVVQMFAVSARCKKKVVEVAARDALAGLLAEFRAGIARPPVLLPAPAATGLMLELAIPDLHAGKHVWGKETGGDNYDLKIALATMREAVGALLERSAHLPFERMLLPVGSDLFNADNLAGTTTRGTPQDNDGRVTKVFGATLRAFIAVIEDAVERTRCPLDVPVVGGNHDALLSYLFGEALAAYFHDHPLVAVDAGPTLRKYREWGEVMLLFAHGDRPQGSNKPDRWAHLMATEQKGMWARTSHREAHVGHLHTKKVYVDEVGGVRVRVLPSLTAADAWHAGEGLVGNQRSAEAFWWDRRAGLVGQALYTVPALPEAA